MSGIECLPAERVAREPRRTILFVEGVDMRICAVPGADRDLARSGIVPRQMSGVTGVSLDGVRKWWHLIKAELGR